MKRPTTSSHFSIRHLPLCHPDRVLPVKTPIFEEISATLKKRGFKFVGPVIVYSWMQASGKVNDHDRRCFRYNLADLFVIPSVPGFPTSPQLTAATYATLG